MKLAAVLIALIALLSILAVVIPQRGYLGTAFDEFAKDAPGLAALVTTLGLDRVYSGWPIVVLATLLVVNLTACTLRRALRRPRADSAHVAPPAALSETADLVRAEGWILLSASDDRFQARKGGSGFWGSVVMHIGLVVIIAGAVATTLTTFRGQMVISEGQTLADERANYESIAHEPRLGQPFSGTRFAVDSTEVTYEEGIVVSAVARMRAIESDGDVVTRNVRVNHPLDAGGKSLLIQNSGYAVRMVLATPGSVPDPVVVALAEETPYGWEDRLEFTSAQGTETVISMLATPVPLGESQPMPAEKFAIRDPRLRLAIRYGAGSWEGVLAPGESSASVNGLVVTFEGLGLWNRFLVRGEPARWITYAGFWIAVAGAAWRFAVPERRLLVKTHQDGMVTASVKSRPWVGLHASGDNEFASALSESATGHAEAAGRTTA